MTEISLAINEQDCTSSDGNAAEELLISSLRASFCSRSNNSANVWVNSTEMAAAGMNMGTALGRVVAHEFGHWALNMVHTYPDSGPLEVGIMSQGFGPILMTGMATLSLAQISRLQSKCQQRHPQGRNAAGGGGNSGGGFPGCQLIEITNCGDEGCGTQYVFICGGGGGGGGLRSTL
jgi:hypothetical protein